MPGKRIWPGKAFEIHAWIRDDGSCELEEFLLNLKARSHSDWKRIVSQLADASEHGPPEDEDQCRLADSSASNNLREFITRGGVRVFWFFYEELIVICSCILMKKKDKAPRTEIDRALTIQKKYIEENRHDSPK